MRFAVSRLLALLFVFEALGAALIAQTPLPRIDETVEVSLVNVDVVVTDRKGNRVRGLTRDDFEVLENGIPQRITNFTEFAPEAQTSPAARMTLDGSAAVAPAAAPARRTIVIFVESFIVQPFHAKPLFERLRETVRRIVRPGDAAMVVSWAGAPIVRQDFTDDVAALERALNEIEQSSSGSPENRGLLLRNQQEVEAMFEDSLAQEAMRELSDTRSRPGDALSHALFQLFKIRQKTFALNSLMQRMSALEGKKVVLMATRRFGEHAGAEFFGGVVPTQYRPLLDTRQYRDSLTDTANAGGITLYPIYPEGLANTRLMTAETNRGSRQLSAQEDVLRTGYDHNVLGNEMRALDDIARETGGLTQWGSKEIVNILPRIAEDLETYYSLAYRTEGSRRGAQRIEVRTKNRAYEVRSRREYMQKTDEAQMEDRVVAALFHDVTGGVIPLRAEVGEPQPTGRRRWTATLRVRIPVSMLTVVETPDGPAGEFSVYVAPGAVFGLSTDVQRRKQPFALDASQAAGADSYFTYEFTLELDHLVDRVSVGVFDQVSKDFGLVRVEVPERKVQ